MTISEGWVKAYLNIFYVVVSKREWKKANKRSVRTDNKRDFLRNRAIIKVSYKDLYFQGQIDNSNGLCANGYFNWILQIP